jgi:hypothetical protein
VPRSENEWSYTSTPQYAFMAWHSVKKAQGQLYIYLCFYLYLTLTKLLRISAREFCFVSHNLEEKAGGEQKHWPYRSPQKYVHMNHTF